MRATRTPGPKYQELGLWDDDSLPTLLARAIRDNADDLAIVDRSVQLTYRDLGAEVDRLAAQLRSLGVAKGDVVLAQLPNWWEAVVLLQAVVRLGAVINPVVTIYREAELAFIVDQASPTVVVVPDRFRGHDHVAMVGRVLDDRPTGARPTVLVARPERPLPSWATALWANRIRGPGARRPDGAVEHSEMEQTCADDIALLLYTSGTTAAPKGVLHSHQTLIYECRSIVELFGLDGRAAIFMPSPLTHITGFLYGMILPTLLGTSCVLMDVWEPEDAARLIEEHRCTFSVAATPFLSGLTGVYERRGESSALAHFACGGADVPPDLVRRATSVLDADVVRIYGSSEMPTYSSGRPGDSLRTKAETDGYPIGTAAGRLAEATAGVGELLVDGPELFLGYLDPALNADAFTDDGYFRTGDLACFDDEGFVTIMGRVKDIIIRKGEKISAREIEDLLYRHPDVAEVAVIAVPDPEFGERACAVVVPAPSAHPTLDELCRYLDTFRVARQKYPEVLELVNELPRNTAGKVQKFVLRERFVASRP